MRACPHNLRLALTAGRRADRRQNGIPIIDDLGIPKPDHGEAEALDLGRPLGVILGFPAMLASIDLNDQPSVDTNEIEGVAEQRNLPAELEPIETAVAQQRPEDVFGLGGLPPKPSGELALFGRHAP